MSAVAHRLCVHFCVARGRNGADRGGSFEMALDRIIDFWNSLPKRASVVEWQTRKFQVLVPPGHEGSTPFGCTIFDSSSGRGRRISFLRTDTACGGIREDFGIARERDLRGERKERGSARPGCRRADSVLSRYDPFDVCCLRRCDSLRMRCRRSRRLRLGRGFRSGCFSGIS